MAVLEHVEPELDQTLGGVAIGAAEDVRPLRLDARLGGREVDEVEADVAEREGVSQLPDLHVGPRQGGSVAAAHGQGRVVGAVGGREGDHVEIVIDND